MPIPTRSTSMRAPAAEKKIATSHIARPTVNSQKPSPTARSVSPTILTNEARQSKKYDSETKSRVSQGNPSRATSPTKRTPSSQSIHSTSTISSRGGLAKGHHRQQSTALPSPNVGSKFGHSRARSVISASATVPKHAAVNLLSQNRVPGSISNNRSVAINDNPTTIKSSRSPANVNALRNDLRQLSITHETSIQNLNGYTNSIDKYMAMKHAQLDDLNEAIHHLQRSHSTAQNLQALDDWVQSCGLQTAMQIFQDLSTTTADLGTLSDLLMLENGLLQNFEMWKQTLQDIQTGALHEEVLDPSVIWYTQILPDVQALKPRIAICATVLANLPQCRSNSMLFGVVQDHQILAKTMNSHCDVVVELGTHLLAEHERWIDTEILATIADLQSDAISTVFPSALTIHREYHREPSEDAVARPVAQDLLSESNAW